MPGLLPDVDPDGLLEYSVVFTDRSLNSMSKSFQQVMNDIHRTLCEVYKADSAVVVPGGGTFGMEAVARQFASDEKCLVVRNGWFSFRWSQICDAGNIPKELTVMRARQYGNEDHSPFSPPPIDEVVARIADEQPAVVFAPHVETSAGMMLSDDYIKQLADAAHDAGGIFVLDCIASGCMWVDMAALGVDVLISAPQKGWSASPAAGLVMLSSRAVERMEGTSSSSFAVDLKKWHQIMQAYLN
ncbi:MAG: aminotransferase class V-fold PLP-dependent enzyme, partial [Planctomycetota bacterium]